MDGLRKPWAATALRVAAAVVLSLILPVAVLQGCLQATPVPRPSDLVWGTTFSQKQCASLGVDPWQAYDAVLNDLHPRVVRLIAYWDGIEPARGVYDFRDLDRQVSEAASAGVQVTLAIGQKLPRWPEYHYPRWLDVSDANLRTDLLLRYEAEVVRRYRGSGAIRYWQVENEPFLDFGHGPAVDRQTLDAEVALVHRLDSRHPVLITDGGEWGGWVQAAGPADVFGTSLYRRVWDPRLGSFTYPLTPEYYDLKQVVTRMAVGRTVPVICAELGAEPWGPEPTSAMTLQEQTALFPPGMLPQVADYARRARFRECYLWGAEWWYYRAVHGDPSYWREAKAVIASGER